MKNGVKLIVHTKRLAVDGQLLHFAVSLLSATMCSSPSELLTQFWEYDHLDALVCCGGVGRIVTGNTVAIAGGSAVDVEGRNCAERNRACHIWNLSIAIIHHQRRQVGQHR